MTKDAFLRCCLLSLAAFGCAHAPEKNVSHAQDLLIRDSETMVKPWRLSRAEIKSDTDLLIYALQNAYGGRNHVPRAQFEAAMAQLEKAKENDGLTPFEFCHVVDQALLEIQDQHLFPWLIGMSCEEQRSSRIRKGQIGFNRQPSRVIPWSYEEQKIQGKKVGILAIAAFPPHEDASWKGFSESLARARQTSALIIDLRGNPGGDDTRGQELAKMLYGRQFPTPVLSRVKSQTPETMAILVNNAKFHILSRKSKKEEVPGYAYDRLERAMERLRLADAGQMPAQVEYKEELGPPFDPRIGYDRPVLVIADAECASSCESTLDFLELHPRVVTLGENTNGSIHFGNMGFVVLPNSKVLVQMASDFWKYRDGRFIEGVGHAPKIKVPPGDDAFESAVKELQRMSSRQ